MRAVMKIVLPERDRPVTPKRNVGVIMSVSTAPARCHAWRAGSSGSEWGSEVDKEGDLVKVPLASA